MIRTRFVPLAALAAALVAVAPFVQAPEASAQTPAACPDDVTITVAAPTADAPTTVTVTIAPEVIVKSPSEADPDSFHLHYFVDTEAVAAGEAVPAGDPSIIHSASTTQDLGELAEGEHTVTVVLGQFDHTACAARGDVAFTIAAATATPTPAATPAATATPTAPTPPDSGNVGLLPDAQGAAPVLAMIAALVAGALVVGSRAVTRRG